MVSSARINGTATTMEPASDRYTAPEALRSTPLSESDDKAFTSAVASGRLPADSTTCPSASTTLAPRSEEHTSELQSLMRISYAVFCLKKKKNPKKNTIPTNI